MDPAPTLVVRPVTALGVSQLAVLLRDADGREEEILRRPGMDTPAVTAEIESRLAASGGAGAGLVIDLESCDWVDSGVLGVWVAWYHTVTNGGGRIVISRPNERIRNILRISQLDQLFPTHTSLDAAVADLASTA
jgi:anti-anti-sigma factor